jgi:serine/threonine-protein kinase
VGRYRLIRQLGAGGMAEVHLARVTGEAGFEKLVAVKLLQRWLAANAQIVESFLDEARLASRLSHPNIVQVLDLGKADDDYFIAMEYIEGADLQRLLASCRRRGALVPLRVALQILRHVCDGLAAAHSATDAQGACLGLVHRDVKCANVFVARSGAVKIGDFGIAKANQADRQHKTQTGQIKGTTAYMAPEHRLGREVDRRADIFGVGAIGYELLTGKQINLDLLTLMEFGREGWPHLEPPSSVRAEIPKEIDEVLWKALAYEKEARYASCDEMEEALDALVQRFALNASDKAVAHWIEAELAVVEAPTALPEQSNPRT